MLSFNKKSSFLVLARKTLVNKNFKLKIPKESNKFKHFFSKESSDVKGYGQVFKLVTRNSYYGCLAYLVSCIFM